MSKKKSSSKISVLVADDHPVFRNGLCTLLQSGKEFDCVATASDGEDAVRIAKNIRPNVAIIDVDMPKLSGIEAAKQIKAHNPSTAIVMLSAYRYDHYVLSSIRVGADSYMLKTIPPNELVDIIRKVSAGKKVYDIELTTNLLTKVIASQDKESYKAIQLHKREIEVLMLVAKGKTNKDISVDLNISEHTVGTHLVNIYRKLGAESRTAATLKALQLGCFTIEDLG
jgi:DNA-binding NarL/FixJ family response regulator